MTEEATSNVTTEQLAEIKAGEYWSVKQLALKIKYSPAWISFLCKTGRIKAVKPLGAAWRIPQSEIDKIMQEGIPAPPRKRMEIVKEDEAIEVPPEVARMIIEPPREASSISEKSREKKPFPWSLLGS